MLNRQKLLHSVEMRCGEDDRAHGLPFRQEMAWIKDETTKFQNVARASPRVGLDLPHERRLVRHHVAGGRPQRRGGAAHVGGQEGDDVERADQADHGGRGGRQGRGAVAPDGHVGLLRRRDGRGRRGERRRGRDAPQRRLAGGEVGGGSAEEHDVGHSPAGAGPPRVARRETLASD